MIIQALQITLNNSFMSVCIPYAILLLRKPHDNNESTEF